MACHGGANCRATGKDGVWLPQNLLRRSVVQGVSVQQPYSAHLWYDVLAPKLGNLMARLCLIEGTLTCTTQQHSTAQAAGQPARHTLLGMESAHVASHWTGQQGQNKAAMPPYWASCLIGPAQKRRRPLES